MSVKPFGFFLLIAAFLTITANSHPAQAQTPPASAPAQTTAITSPDTDVLNELKGSIKRCSELQDRGIRMSCYDRLAQSLGFLSAEKVAENEKTLGKIGFWDISSKSGIDGVVQTTLRLESSNTIKSSGDTERHVALVLRCTPGKTEGFLDWKKSVVTGSYVKKATTLVTYVVNGGEKINEDWEISTDQQALFIPDPAAFIRNMMKKQKLTIGFTSAGSFMQNAIFDITGAEAAIDVIVKTCY